MKYFIDFEATQFSEEIISIGCVREDGETFYSLVAPVEGKITPFITNLTGITAEMLQDAMSPNHVFEMFYNWAFTNEDDAPEFWVWGDSDVDYLRHTFRRTTSMKARMAIGYMCGSTQDYAKKFRKRLRLKENVALIKAAKCFDETVEQNHNALDDAMLLFNVYNNSCGHIEDIPAILAKLNELGVAIRSKKEQEKKSTPDYVPKWNELDLPAGTVCVTNRQKRLVFKFDTFADAAQWIYDNKVSDNQKENCKIENIEKQIRKSAAGGKQYYSMTWRVIPNPPKAKEEEVKED